MTNNTSKQDLENCILQSSWVTVNIVNAVSEASKVAG